jgi:hypothetical protein
MSAKSNNCFLLLSVASCLSLMLSTANAYSEKDAGYVTSSKNRAVLKYVVCLEGVMRKKPADGEILVWLERAEKSCAKQAKRLPKSPTEPDAEEIKLMIMECGFKASDADC